MRDDDELKFPVWVKVLQVVLAAAAGAFARLSVAENLWLSIFAFIVAFTIVYAILGFIYLKIKK